MTDSESKRPERQEPPSFAREVGSGLKAEVRTSLRWAFWGAGLGAVVVGAVGFWLLGGTGLAYGAAVGAVAGGFGAWLFYLNV